MRVPFLENAEQSESSGKPGSIFIMVAVREKARLNTEVVCAFEERKPHCTISSRFLLPSLSLFLPFWLVRSLRNILFVFLFFSSGNAFFSSYSHVSPVEFKWTRRSSENQSKMDLKKKGRSRRLPWKKGPQGTWRRDRKLIVIPFSAASSSSLLGIPSDRWNQLVIRNTAPSCSVRWSKG